MKKEKYEIGNIDSIIVAQRPKMAPYIEEMKKNIAYILNTDTSNINIKATTTENLGFVGKEEGIASYSVCILKALK